MKQALSINENREQDTAVMSLYLDVADVQDGQADGIVAARIAMMASRNALCLTPMR
jgi:hypothetical protein